MNEQHIKRNGEMLGIVMAGLVGLAVTGLVKALPGLIGLSQIDAGPLGDWIAGSTSIVLQAIVIYLLVQTYRGQMKELEEQRQLLKLANDESKRKRFEDGFYMLLGRYEQVVKGLGLPDSPAYCSRRVFPSLADECLGTIRFDDYKSLLVKFFSERDWWLGDWIRIVLLITKYVRESDRAPDEQFAYLKLFRGIMSPPEARTFLVYLAIKPKGRSKTGRYLMRMNFFKYSFVASEPSYPKLNEIIKELHGMGIYPASTESKDDQD